METYAKETVGCMEKVNMETYALSYVKWIARGDFLYDAGSLNPVV